MDRNTFHKSWNPPHGDIELWKLEIPVTVDSKFIPKETLRDKLFGCLYRPNILKYLWYGIWHWWKYDNWPIRVLVFPDKREREIFLSVYEGQIQNPKQTQVDVDADFDELFTSN